MSSSTNLFTMLIIVFSTGFVSGLSPCTLPTVIFVTAYVSGRENYSKLRGFALSLSFALGIVFIVSILGMAAGMAGNVIVDSTVLNYITAAVLILMSLWMLGIFQFEGYSKLSNVKMKKGSGLLGAFIMGIPFGISASPCTMPITISILAYAANMGSVLYGGLLLFMYSLGRSIPLILVGTFVGILNNFKGIFKYQKYIEKLSAGVMILIAFYFIWKA